MSRYPYLPRPKVIKVIKKWADFEIGIFKVILLEISDDFENRIYIKSGNYREYTEKILFVHILVTQGMK